MNQPDHIVKNSPQAPAQCCEVDRTERRGWTYTPSVDIVELEDAFLLEADLPGAERGRIDVTVDEGVLSVQAPVPAREAGRERVARHEYGVGGFHRRFRIDRTIDVAGIEASYDLGVLTVRLPKASEARSRRISVA